MDLDEETGFVKEAKLVPKRFAKFHQDINPF